MRNRKDILLSGILIAFCILVPTITNGQAAAVYNINKYNGLSSNHVYCTLVDRLGYLWFGTTDGVYRYNGYSLRKYDYTDGLPNVDVWNLYEDRQGRIWLRSIASQMGYIKNNRYYKVYKETADPDFEIYPGEINEIKDTITFSNVTLDNQGNFLIWYIINDTLRLQHLTPLRGVTGMVPVLGGSYIYHSSDLYTPGSFLLQYRLDNILTNGEYGQPVNKIPSADLLDIIKTEPYIRTYSNKYLVFYKATRTGMYWANLKTGDLVNHSLPDSSTERYLFCFTSGEYFGAITNEKVMLFDTTSTLKYKLSPDSLYKKPDISGFTNTYFFMSEFWGNILATKNSGCYLRYSSTQNLKHCYTELSDYTFLNNKNNTDGYWWNNNERILAIVRNAQIIKKIPLPNLHNVKKVAQYDSMRSLISNDLITYWLYSNNTTSAVTKSGYTFGNTNNIGSFDDFMLIGAFGHSNDIVVTGKKEAYVLGTALMGVYNFRVNDTEKKITIDHVNEQRFNKVVVNKPYNIVICYSSNKILFIFPDNGNQILISQNQFKTLGINTIEKIMVDNYGNMYVKDYNSLKFFDIRRNIVKPLLGTFKLEQAVVEIIDNNLFVAGNFGILKANLHADGDITITNTFSNIKNIYYKYISDVQFSTDYALLKTDNGYYAYSYTDYSNTPIDSYRIIADYGDTLVSLSHNDTLAIPQNLSVINLDVINPTGTGNLRIEYSINKATYQFSENQLILPALKPGSYNTVSIIASDDSWRSKPIKFTIYIQPEWWQTQTAKRVILVLSLLAFIGFVYLVIVMTRRFVNRANERRNQRRELELKSIYSQINPHFIFNSLSTAQYFVKKNQNKEAFEHINQFSDLLRAYIKSSRAKYISIDEEIENLENYLQLQLTRFEEKFDYTIKVDKSVNPHKVKIPSLLLQPLVENALNHGIFHSDKKGNLSIIFKIDGQDKDTLVCIVDDDGIGRQKSKEMRGKIIRKADSYGTILIKELIDTFNKYEKINIEIEYVDKQPPLSGTTVVVRIRNYAQS